MDKPTLTRKKSQVQKIVDASQEVFFTPADKANELAFMSKCFIQATLPHSDPGDVPLWWRKSGNYTLSIQPDYVPGAKGKPRNIGLPYGSLPRLLLAWANGEVVKTQSPELVLGSSLAEFMEKLGYESFTGGKNGSITRLKTQVVRLFSSKISLSYENQHGSGVASALLAKETFFFWDPKQPDQQTLWESRIVLSDEFFRVLLSAPVPLDWRILKAIKRSPLALDLYMWLSYRVFSLDKPVQIPWETLAQQFGSEYKDIFNFRHKVRKHLLKIRAFWHDLNINVDNEEFLELCPSRLLIQPTTPKGLPKPKKAVQKRPKS
jgi:Plasmid encoded RepA protein